MPKKQTAQVTGNLLIFLMVAFAAWMMMTGTTFSGRESVLTASRIAMFKYFTVDSNLLMGAAALIRLIWTLRHREEDAPRWLCLLTYAGTVSVTLTLLTVVFFLGPVLLGGYGALFNDSNLFFHGLVPAAAILVLVLFERTSLLRFRDTLWGMLPMVLYAVYYVWVAFSHMEAGKVSFQYDWYGFAQGGISGSIISLGVMLLGTWVICLLLWLGSRKRS